MLIDEGKEKSMKKFLTILLSTLIIFICMSTNVFAADHIPISITVGETYTVTLTNYVLWTGDDDPTDSNKNYCKNFHFSSEFSQYIEIVSATQNGENVEVVIKGKESNSNNMPLQYKKYNFNSTPAQWKDTQRNKPFTVSSSTPTITVKQPGIEDDTESLTDNQKNYEVKLLNESGEDVSGTSVPCGSRLYVVLTANSTEFWDRFDVDTGSFTLKKSESKQKTLTMTGVTSSDDKIRKWFFNVPAEIDGAWELSFKLSLNVYGISNQNNGQTYLKSVQGLESRSTEVYNKLRDSLSFSTDDLFYCVFTFDGDKDVPDNIKNHPDNVNYISPGNTTEKALRCFNIGLKVEQYSYDSTSNELTLVEKFENKNPPSSGLTLDFAVSDIGRNWKACDLRGNNVGSYDTTQSGRTLTVKNLKFFYSNSQLVPISVLCNETVSTIKIDSYPTKYKDFSGTKKLVTSTGSEASSSNVSINSSDTSKYEVVDMQLATYGGNKCIAIQLRPKTGFVFADQVGATGFNLYGGNDKKTLEASASDTINGALGTSLTISNGDVLALAEVSEYLSTATVTFNENGGTWESGYTKPTEYPIGTGLSLPTSENIKKTDYTFAGWYDNADCTGDAVTSITTSDTGNKEYWAKWTQSSISVTGVSLNKDATTITVGENETLTATVTPENATNKGVSWSSNNESVARVDSAGKVTAIAEGSAVITVKTNDEEKTAKCTVTVEAAAQPQISDVVESAEIIGTAKVGQTLTAKVTFKAEEKPVIYQWYRAGQKIEGATSKEYILTEEDNNKVISVTIKCEGYTGELSATVSDKVSGRVDAKVDDEAGLSPDVSEDNLKKAINIESLTDEEKQKYEAGDTLKIVLEIKDNSKSIKPESKELINSKLAEDTKTKDKENLKVEQYLDISLFRYFVSAPDIRTKITNAKTDIEIVLTVPESIRDADKTYAIAKNHEGKVTIFGTYDPDNKTISFSTKEFSDYAIISWKTDSKQKKEEKQEEKQYNKSDDKIEKKEVVYIDYDTFKSELPSHSVLAINKDDMTIFKDMKVHALDNATTTNQKKLAEYYAGQMGKRANIILTYGVYNRSDLPLNEIGSKKILTWNNLSYKTPGAIYAVCYNQKDGAYLISGSVNANGTAAFIDFIMNEATNVTIFTAE